MSLVNGLIKVSDMFYKWTLSQCPPAKTSEIAPLKNLGLLFVAGREDPRQEEPWGTSIRKQEKEAILDFGFCLGNSEKGEVGKGREEGPKETGVWPGLGAVRKWERSMAGCLQRLTTGRADWSKDKV